MKLVGYVEDGIRQIGRLEGDLVVPLGPVSEFYDPASTAADPAVERRPLATLERAPFVPVTARVFCVGINYPSHGKEAKEVGNLDFPQVPMIFGRWESTLVSSGDPVPVPAYEGLDWEAELAVVIGKSGWCVDESEAMGHVLGYTAFNDLSARLKQTDTIQFTLGKNADRSGPIGPVLVTADEVGDPANLRVRARVNGETVQDGNTSEMFHSIARVISYISDTVTLLPGDVIATGTPAGVGHAMKPPRFLSPGDIVEVEVEGIGVLTNPIVHHEDLAPREVKAAARSGLLT